MAYEAVVLVDPEGRLLRADQRAALAEYVRAGGGLVLIGSGPRRDPADLDDPLNRVAALVANPFQRHPLGVTVVLDASGSMAQADAPDSSRRRFDDAIEAVAGLARYMTDRDTLAVVTFADEPRDVYDSGDGSPDFAALNRALRAVTPAGPTDVWPAILRAATPATGERRRLVLIASDLETQAFDTAIAARTLADVGAALAVVAVGPGQGDAPSPLAELARLRAAPFVVVGRAGELVDVFGRFVRRHRGPSVRRGQFSVATELSSAPPATLTAYVLCAPAAETTRVLGRVEDDSVFAFRHVGLGRSASVAVPLAPDSPDVIAAGTLARLALLWAAQPAGDPRFDGEIERAGREARVRVRAFDDDGPMDDLSLEALSTGPRGGPLAERTPLAQVAPGVYEARLPDASHAQWVSVVDVSRGRRVWQGPFVRRCAAEFDAVGPDWPALERLARLAGGRIVRTPSQAQLRDAAFAPGRIRLWPVAVVAAIAATLTAWLLRPRAE